MTLRHHIKTQSTSKILLKASRALVRDAIQSNRRKLDQVSSKLRDVHGHLAATLHPTLWAQVDHVTMLRAHDNTALTTKLQQRKFEKLRDKQQQRPAPNKPDELTVVHNLSDQPLDAATLSVLAKGFNFAIAPSRLPTEDIITGVESAIAILPDKEAETIRQLTCEVLRKAKPPAKNTTYDEIQALKALKRNEEIIVLPADKGNATVVMNSADYKHKMLALLEDPAYKKHATDPTTYLEKTTRQKILASPIDLEVKKFIIPREKSSRCPKIYGLPKIHKAGAPLRPIVSSVGSPVQRLAGHLAKYLQPYTEMADSYVRNAEHLIELLSDQRMQPDHLLASFDVVSLFTKVPVRDALDIIRSELEPPEHITGLIEHCLENTYFSFDGQMYKQIEGAPMGSPLSPVIANLYMTNFEVNALETAALKPTLWLRYVDDTLVIWPHGRAALDAFLLHLNAMNEHIQFTMEIEENECLPFLDVMIIKYPDGSLGHTVYRKPTHTNRYLNAASHHHPAQLASVANTLAIRSKRLADRQHSKSELNNLRKALRSNGFSEFTINKAFQQEPRRDDDSAETQDEPRATAFLPYVRGTTDRISKILRQQNIKTVFKTDRKIASCLRNAKDAVPHESHGVYEVPCGSCSQTYVGKTNRKISARLDEHRVAVARRQTTSTLAQHVLNEGHWIDFDNAKTLVRLDHERPRIYREAIEIEKRPHCLNTRDDAMRLPATWKPTLADRRVNPVSPPTQSSGPPPGRIDKRRKKPVEAINTPTASRRLRSSRPAPAVQPSPPVTTTTRIHTAQRRATIVTPGPPVPAIAPSPAVATPPPPMRKDKRKKKVPATPTVAAPSKLRTTPPIPVAGAPHNAGRTTRSKTQRASAAIGRR